MAITRKVLAQRASKQAAADKEQADLAYLAEHGMSVGDFIRIEGDRSMFRVFGVGSDGSITCIDQEQKAFRSFRPEWCFPAYRVNRRGRKVRTTVPADRKGLRASWMAERGLPVRTEPALVECTVGVGPHSESS